MMNTDPPRGRARARAHRHAFLQLHSAIGERRSHHYHLARFHGHCHRPPHHRIDCRTRHLALPKSWFLFTLRVSFTCLLTLLLAASYHSFLLLLPQC